VPLAGIGVLVLALLFVLGVWEDGSGVDLPRVRYLSGEDREEFGSWFVLESSGALRHAGDPVSSGEVEALLRAAASGIPRTWVGLCADRKAPWRDMRDFLAAAWKYELPVTVKVKVESGGVGYMVIHHRLVADPEAPPEVEERVTVVPPADPARIRRETTGLPERWRTYDARIVVLRFEPHGEPDVQAVVSTWECYALDNAVYLRSIR